MQKSTVRHPELVSGSLIEKCELKRGANPDESEQHDGEGEWINKNKGNHLNLLSYSHQHFTWAFKTVFSFKLPECAFNFIPHRGFLCFG